MSTLVRRYLVLTALLFWLGGFTFYSSVVVFVGQQQIGHRRQGFITAEVTNYLNLASALALAVLAVDLFRLKESGRLRRWLWLCWAGILGSLGGLLWLHQELAGLMIPADHGLTDLTQYRSLHRSYLWVSTVQWLFGLIYLGLLVRAWRQEDRKNPEG